MAVKSPRLHPPASSASERKPFDDQWFQEQPGPHRKALLIAWFAAIEAGVLDPLCSTLGQRLELVQCLAGIENQTAWRTMAPTATSGGGLSSLLNGKRGKAGTDIKPVTRRQILGLIQATKFGVDLPWIVFGSEPRPSLGDFWERLKWALELDRRSVRLQVQEDDDLPEELTASTKPEMPAPPAARRLATRVAARIPGGFVSVEWLLTGRCSPPREVFDLATKTSAEIGSTKAKQDADLWPMAWSPSLLTPLLALTLRHKAELPDALRERIVNQLMVPFGEHLNFSPVLLGADRAGRLDDREIRNLRWDMFLSICTDFLGKEDELIQRLAQAYGLIGRKQADGSTASKPPQPSNMSDGVVMVSMSGQRYRAYPIDDP